MTFEDQCIILAICCFGGAIFCALAITVEAVWSYLTN